MLRSEIEIEICKSDEWWRVFGPLDGEDDETVLDFSRELFNEIESLGYAVVWARGERRLCYGWHGANKFAMKIGGIGTFDRLPESLAAELVEI